MDIKIIAEYIRKKLENDYETEKISVADTAEKFGYSKYEFSRKFKKETGFSAKEFISLLKLEKSIQKLVKEHKSIIFAQMEVGYESSGSFSNIFKKNTGLSPKEYKKNIEKLYEIMKQYKENEELLQETYYEYREKENGNKCTVTLIYPENYKSDVTFIGLFRTPVPNHAPIVGKAVIPYKTGNKCIFTNIPEGSYYILACSIEKNSNIFRYFDLKKCLRGKVEEKITFPLKLGDKKEFEILLREAIPEDPPILVNLPNLVFKVIKKGK
ncbi:MAG: helix-turn-helix transcriptional regulator [Leptotrichiaceae bacterium]|nr:helix-turn-helix transcriptional regulator [Leptotrichiaceae bacterium]